MHKITKLNFGYDNTLLFKSLSIRFETGINYLNWISGKGKTTLLNLIADKYDGIDFGSVAFMQQDTILFDWLNVKKNLEYLAPNRLPTKLLKELGLDDKLDMKISELSGGQKRRLYLAMVLNHEADTYLFDEPFTGTDDKTIAKIESYLKTMKDKTIIIASHKIKKA